jgi:hypothetical protein
MVKMKQNITAPSHKAISDTSIFKNADIYCILSTDGASRYDETMYVSKFNFNVSVFAKITEVTIQGTNKKNSDLKTEILQVSAALRQLRKLISTSNQTLTFSPAAKNVRECTGIVG